VPGSVFPFKMRDVILILSVGLVSAVNAQTLKLPASIDKLAETADEVIDVTVDPAMLHFTERVLSDRNPDQARAKRVLRGIRVVKVKSLKFDRDGAYSAADIEAIRAQLKSPGWSRLVEVRSRKSDNVDVFVRSDKGEIAGMVVIAAEPRELTIVDIDGNIRPEDLAELRGRAGVPRGIF
jgi:hypothetical protein